MSYANQKEKLLAIYKDFDIVFPKHTNKDFIKTANEIVDHNIFNVTSFGKVDFQDGVNWNDQRGRTFNRWFHSHFFMGDLISAYEKSGEVSFLNKAFSLYEEWSSVFEGNIENRTAYHDETIAKRLTFWLRLYIVGYDIFEEKKKSKLERSILLTAELLAGEKFHDKNTNHGMFVDLALLLFTYVFEKDESFIPWRDKAISRLMEYFDFVYTSEGVHKEQTPAYHYTISLQLLRYSIAFKNYNKTLSRYLYNKYLITNTFGYQIIKPDGKIPQIGDNAALQVKDLVFKDLYDDPEFKYAISAGDMGIVPKENDIVFKEAGYAIFRDDWLKKKKATYILFNAAYNSNYHKHSDDLSVLIHKDGDIFVEAGPNGYEYKDPYTEYGYSQFAHNSLVVDNQSLPRVDNKFDKVNIINSSIEPDYCEVEGENGRYEDVIHRRKLKYNKKENHIIVNDEIISTSEHNYSLFWHMAPNIVIEEKSGKYFIKKTDSYIGEIIFSSDSNFVFNQQIGQVSPIIKGWHFPKMREKQQNYFVELSLTGNNVKITTEIILYNEPKTIQNLDFNIDAKIINGQLRAKVLPVEQSKDYLYAFYIRKDGHTIEKIMYSNQNEIKFDLKEKGKYSLRCFLKSNKFIESKQSVSLLFEGEKPKLENEYVYKDSLKDITYILQEGKEYRDYLLVVFSGHDENRPLYSYRRFLSDIDCNKLFILDNYGYESKGCWYLGENMDFLVEKSVKDLIGTVQEKYNISHENVILGGSSKGGFSSIYFGMKYHYGHIIAAAPQVFLSKYFSKYSREYLLEGICGEITEDKRKIIDNLIIDETPTSNQKFYFYCGCKDSHLNDHLLPLIKNMISYTDNIYLELLPGGHANIGKEFGPK
ncbi:heparinase II/III family protein, partial [Neobacillus drentensis]|uniref:heparinase II/III domain-containing protein n=1 Tax=Neobacillus drentensis TaxID=220684 RepID=UPI002FFF7C92